MGIEITSDAGRHSVLPHWADEFYRRIDAGDPTAVEFWSDDIFMLCGNFPPTRGLAAAAAGPIPRIVEAMSSIRHEVLNRWDIADDQVVYQFIVHYVRTDGRPVSLPAITTIHRNADGRFDDLRLYIDAAPLLEGLSARMVGAVYHALPSQDRPLRDDWMRRACLNYARSPARFLPEITECRIFAGEATGGAERPLVRDVTENNGERYSERLLIDDAGLTTTRFRSDLVGDAHIRINEVDGRQTLSLQFDMRWNGVGPASALLAAKRASMMDQGRRLLEQFAIAAVESSAAMEPPVGKAGGRQGLRVSMAGQHNEK